MFNASLVKEQIIQWIREYFDKNGTSDERCECSAVVGISGGIDSSVTAALCVKALGASRVIGVLMPYKNQHDIDFSHELSAFLGIKYINFNIMDSTDALLSGLEKSFCNGNFAKRVNKQAVINTPARIRMTALYAVSAVVSGRVANTCNLSEDWVGYSTKYGDAAGDFSPLSCLTKTEVKMIAKELNLPSKFIDKTPEDGLSGLSDEENLGFTYDVLDRYIREGICEDTEIRKKIDHLHQMNKHKLMLMPKFEM